IAVDDAVFVRVLERFEDLIDEVERFGDREPALSIHPLAERLALEKLHDQEEGAARCAPEVGDAHDVLIVETRGRLRFALEAFDDLWDDRQLRSKELHGHLLRHQRVLDTVDSAHTARPEAADDPVALPDDVPRLERVVLYDRVQARVDATRKRER